MLENYLPRLFYAKRYYNDVATQLFVCAMQYWSSNWEHNILSIGGVCTVTSRYQILSLTQRALPFSWKRHVVHLVYKLGITVYACNICEFLITLHLQFYLGYKNILMVNVYDVYLELTSFTKILYI